MGEKTLLQFAWRFQTVTAWREAMLARGYTMPQALCHWLSLAMTHLKLTFPEAFRLLWEDKEIVVAGHSLIYDVSPSKLWDEKTGPPSPPPADVTPRAIGWDRDVLALIPPTEDIVRLESSWGLAADSSPLMKLALWQPSDEDEQWFRQFLLDFGHDVAAARKIQDPGEGVGDEETYARLKELAFKDEVTGLYNRRFFSIRLEEEISRHWDSQFEHPVSVVLIDLDDFKTLNDDLGYAAGDETLRGMAEILLRHTRGINVICHYGGNRFATLLVETSKAGARLYADRIRYVLSRSQFTHKRPVTASFGIASLPEDAVHLADELILAANEALCAAKRAGKNRVGMLEDNGTGRQ